jgi:hypothetical protein
MAHCAEIKQKVDPTGFTADTQWIVERVIVVCNDEADPEGWCAKLFGGTWKQCSYTNSIRSKYPGPGYVYDESADVFLTQQPFASWTKNNEYIWVAPIPRPPSRPLDENGDFNGGPMTWDEENQRWYSEKIDGSGENWLWNSSTLAWE